MIKPIRNFKPAWIAALAFVAFASMPALAQNAGKPYDEKLNRLSELLGAMHYLRELCVAKDGQKWRNAMKELIEAEGTSPARRAAMSRHFNHGYRSYSRTYRSCTALAQTTIDSFIKESISITDELLSLATPRKSSLRQPPQVER